MDSGFRRLLSASAPGNGADGLPAGVRWTVLALLGFGAGISPVFYGYFDLAAWGPIAVGLIAIAIGLLLARPALPTGLPAVALLAVFLFAAWALLSIGWAESADRALGEGDRWLLHGVFLLVALLLISNRRDGEVFLVAAAVGILGVAASDLLRMFGSEASTLFSGSRLVEPLGYVNGLGGYFLLGFWPLAALAERARWPALAGAAAGAATLLAALVVLTEARGTVFAFGVSAALVLALLPGRNRRAWLLLAVLAGLVVAWDPLTDVTRALPAGAAPAEQTIERAGESILFVALGVGVIWGLASWAVTAARSGSSGLATYLPRVSAALLCAAALVGVVGATAAVSDPIGKVSDQYDAFTELEPTSKESRFTSGGGNRYDYWRIAWEQFTDHPLNGVGAGNFNRTYFIERRTREDVRQAHSIELQTLGDTGLVGALLLGTFFVAVFAGLWRRSRAARQRDSEVGLTVAAAGIFAVWLAQTSVDWLHLIPGVTAVALGAAAILLLSPAPAGGAERRPRLRALPPLATVGLLALALVAVVFIGRPTLAQHLLGEAQGRVATDPAVALERVDESLSLNPDSLQAYYTKAAALARLGAYRPARQALGEAIEHEPHNYVSWALLGDLTTRRGDFPAALRAYRRASTLNPRDRELRALGSDRALLVRLHERPDAPALLETAGD